MPRIAVIVLLSLLAWATPSRIALAQVRQCIGGDGALVYTDRKCEDIGARERPASDAADCRFFADTGQGEAGPGRGLAGGGDHQHQREHQDREVRGDEP